MSGEFKPRRYAVKDLFDNDLMYVNSYMNSYSDKFNSTNVFNIPEICKDSLSSNKKNLRKMSKFNFI